MIKGGEGERGRTYRPKTRDFFLSKTDIEMLTCKHK